jgi:3-oxoacyl-[acyl-carrier-protein] synthase II
VIDSAHSPDEVVITGLGVVSPIGIGREAFWAALVQGRSGVRSIGLFDATAMPVHIGGEVTDFQPAAYVSKRKSLKLMSRDAQLGVAASTLACHDAGLVRGGVDPERLGVVMGADRVSLDLDECEATYRPCVADGGFDFRHWADGMAKTFPLLFLKVLPNMIASHVAIEHDARGPNNTMHHAELSGLLAVSEACRTIQRGAADVMIVGGASSQLNPFDWVRHCVLGSLSCRQEDPSDVLRPFDARRDGEVWGEGAALMVLERRSHAEARGAEIRARVLSCATAWQPGDATGPAGRAGLRAAIATALRRAGVQPDELGHVNVHGLSTVEDDRAESRALADVVPGVPVLAPKSYFGNLGAAAGAVEMAASVLALESGLVPSTLNYRQPDPECPVHPIVGGPIRARSSLALTLNWTRAGQATVVVLGGP